MEPAITVALIGAGVTIATTIVTNISTQNKLMQEIKDQQNEIEKHNALQDAEMAHVKQALTEVRADIKEHNHYAKLFSESMPVVQEQIRELKQHISNK